MLGWWEWRWLRGIYSPQPPKQPLGRAVVNGRTGQSCVQPDNVRCASHVTQPLGFGRSRPLEPLSSSGTGQSGAAPDMYCSLSGVPPTLPRTVPHVRYFCSRPLREVVVAPLVHWTVRWHTGQSGEL
jgi:hypothetical protein